MEDSLENSLENPDSISQSIVSLVSQDMFSIRPLYQKRRRKIPTPPPIPSLEDFPYWADYENLPERPLPNLEKNLTDKHRISEGGMGRIFLSNYLSLDLVLKVLKPRNNGEEQRSSGGLEKTLQYPLSFEREVTMQRESSLLIPAPKIYEAGQRKDGGDYYIIMEYIPGKELHAVIRPQGKPTPLPLNQIKRIGRELAYHLHTIHQAGILHLDLKPHNIIINNKVYLIDFGLSKKKERQKNRKSKVLGTIGYIAPELLYGYEPDEKSDQFSLGAVLYEMITGKLPIDYLSPHNPSQINEEYLRSLYHKISDPRTHVTCPDSLAETAMRCLHPLPYRRFPDCLEVAKALSSV